MTTFSVTAWPFVMASTADANMTCRQMAILALVAEQPGMSNKPIADLLNARPPVVTRAADRLIELGLMMRAQDTEDRRKVALTVTAAGQQLLRNMASGT
jgi:DNA-binding MarR family transcriptional regulator